VLVRFVASALSLDPADVDPAFAAAAIERVATDLTTSAAALDQAAWRWQRAH
jgi:K+-transporting ATPase c subunit